MKNDLAKVLITQEEIQRRVSELGAQIARDYVEKEPILVCILKGLRSSTPTCAAPSPFP